MASSTVPPIEIGSLSALSPDESQFIGSSSGVFFVNTVYRAFAKSNRTKQSQHSADTGSCIVGPEISTIAHTNPSPSSGRDHGTSSIPYGSVFDGYNLGCAPKQEVARELIKTHFQSWHPLFPFLNGKAFLSDVESFYATEVQSNSGTSTTQHKQACRAIIFQCIFSIAALDRTEIIIPPECLIPSSSAIMALIGRLGMKHDLTSIQALLAAQLYLIATMALQPASIVGGVLLRSLFHAGYHRCPSRYGQISQVDCDIRKRVFWSAYIADRYISQALGIPLGMQDSDIDVCILGGEELHQSVGKDAPAGELIRPREEVLAHLPNGHPNLARTASDINQRSATTGPSDIYERRGAANNTFQSSHARLGGDVFHNYITYCQLTGRALELFHKSIHSRAIKSQDILTLNSEIQEWWNRLPGQLQDFPATTDTEGSFAAFFNVRYQQLILLVNRPFLSRDLDSPEFRLSMQTCINSSRLIIRALKDPRKGKRVFSWPGNLSSLWMSGLVLAFACQLGLYPFAKGTKEIEICLELLRDMGTAHHTAQHCHNTLKVLLSDLRKQSAEKGECSPGEWRSSSSRTTSQRRSNQETSNPDRVVVNGTIITSKRQRTSYELNDHTINRSREDTALLDPTFNLSASHMSGHQTESIPSGNMSLNPGSGEANCGLGHSQNTDDNQSEELRWSNDPLANGFIEQGDLFGQVSWESLFQGNNDDFGDFGWDFPINNEIP